MNLTEKQYKSFMLGLAMGRQFTTVKKKDVYVEEDLIINKKPIVINGGKNYSYVGGYWISGGNHLFAGGIYGGTSINLFYTSYINKISGVATYPIKGYFNIYVNGVLVGTTDRFDLVEGENQVKSNTLLDIDETIRGDVSFELVIEKDGEDDTDYEIVIPDYDLIIGVETEVERDKVGAITRQPWSRTVTEKIWITDFVVFEKFKQGGSDPLDLTVIDRIMVITDKETITLHKQIANSNEDTMKITDKVIFERYKDGKLVVDPINITVREKVVISDSSTVDKFKENGSKSKDTVKITDMIIFTKSKEV